MKPLRVGILCEFSGVVRDAFRARGHDAVSCDLLPSEAPGPHIQGDCLAQDWSGFDLLVAHPPCTYLCNSGVHLLKKQAGRWASMVWAAQFFSAILRLPVPHIAVENPIMHGYGRQIIGHGQDQIVQPWQFGDNASKATCLWLKNLPRLEPTDVLPGGRLARRANQTPSGQNKLGPSPERAKLRAKTYPGIAAAMATQWGSLVPPPPAENGQRRQA